MGKVIHRERCPRCGAPSDLVVTLIYTTQGEGSSLTGVEMRCLSCGYARDYHIGPPPPDMIPPDS
jgi:rubredoxin